MIIFCITLQVEAEVNSKVIDSGKNKNVLDYERKVE